MTIDKEKDSIMLGLKIIALRKELNLTQQELSEKIGMTRSALSQIEIAIFQPSYESLNRIFNLGKKEIKSLDYEYFFNNDRDLLYYKLKDKIISLRNAILNSQDFYIKASDFDNALNIKILADEKGFLWNKFVRNNCSEWGFRIYKGKNRRNYFVKDDEHIVSIFMLKEHLNEPFIRLYK